MKDSIDKLLFDIIVGSLIVAAGIAFVTAAYLGKIDMPFSNNRPAGAGDARGEMAEVASSNPEIDRALRNGEWRKAAELFERAYGVRPSDKKDAETLGLILHNLAVSIANDVDGDMSVLTEAASTLERAASLLATDASSGPKIARGLAMIALKAYQSNHRIEGRKWAEQAKRIFEDEPYVSYVLGSIALSEGRYIDAEPLLKKGLDDKNESIRASASDLLKEISADASREKEFSTQSTSRFTIRFEGNPQPSLSSRVINILEQQSGRAREITGHTPARSLEVIVYTSPSFAVKRGLPDWVGAYFDGRIRLSAVEAAEADGAELNRILGHELTHASIFDRLGRPAPTWFEEGMAQVVTDGAAPSKSRCAAEIGSSGVSLSTLGGDFTRLPANDARAAYALSYASIAYLMQSRGGNIGMRILEGLANGGSMDEVLRANAGLGVQELDAAARTWLTQER